MPIYVFYFLIENSNTSLTGQDILVCLYLYKILIKKKNNNELLLCHLVPTPAEVMTKAGSIVKQNRAKEWYMC